ncbi:MAG: DUF2852 domain-containing protein [Alphaproteobacteria bacterium]|nr:DUF2852 domain-containing protein [Alphaproteobacteria bacterium]
MTTADATLPARSNWFARAEAWLDDRGKGAWIVATVLGFIFFWPIGLALLVYMIWSKRMFKASHARHRSYACSRHARTAFKSSGNSAFDTYKEETLRRLQEEQDAFEAFIGRLRDAKDKAEFDEFMKERKHQDTEAPRADTGSGDGDAGDAPRAES